MDIKIGQQINSAIFTAAQASTVANKVPVKTSTGASLTVSSAAPALPGETISGVSQSQIDAAMVRDDDLGKALKGAFNFPAPPMPFPAE